MAICLLLKVFIFLIDQLSFILSWA